MHSHFSFNTQQILWTLTFAAQLTLLAVLAGRGRVKRFPWFTANIGATGLIELASLLLHGRVSTLLNQLILLAIHYLWLVTAVALLLELVRPAFAGAKPGRRIGWTAAMMVVSLTVVALWGQWPGWSQLTSPSWDTVLLWLRLLSLKTSLLINISAVELCLMILLFGARFHAGWRTHIQQISIGLSTTAVAQMVLVGTLQAMGKPATREEYTQLLRIQDGLFNTNDTVTIAVLIWWIVWLWLEEPGTEAAAETTPQAVAESAAPVPGTRRYGLAVSTLLEMLGRPVQPLEAAVSLAGAPAESTQPCPSPVSAPPAEVVVDPAVEEKQTVVVAETPAPAKTGKNRQQKTAKEKKPAAKPASEAGEKPAKRGGVNKNPGAAKKTAAKQTATGEAGNPDTAIASGKKPSRPKRGGKKTAPAQEK